MKTVSHRYNSSSARSCSLISRDAPIASRRAPRRTWLAPTLGALTAAALLVPSVFAGPNVLAGLSKLQPAAKLTYYRDSRNYGTMNILTSASRLPLGLNFWGFTDIHGNQGGGGGQFERYFMEYRLSRPLPPKYIGIQGLGFQAEFNDFRGAGNSLARFGVPFAIAPTGTAAGCNGATSRPRRTAMEGKQASSISFRSRNAPRSAVSPIGIGAVRGRAAGSWSRS